MEGSATRQRCFPAPLAMMIAGAFLLGAARPVEAAKVVLRIRAGNPVDEAQTVDIRSNLPPRVEKEDVLSLDGLELGYDVKNDIYYVHGQVELGPREIRVYNVEIDDIWQFAPDELDALQSRARKLVGMLRGYDYHEAAAGLLEDIETNLGNVARFQAQNAIGRVRPVQHIRAYEANAKVLSRVKRDIGRIENLVLGTGQDPGGLVGEINRVVKPAGESEIAPEDYQQAVIRIAVSNTSPTESRTVSVKRDLPPEIKPYDIVDAGGLEIGTDYETGAAYVYRDNLELEPGETVTFDVRVRDKWNINKPAMEEALEKARSLRERIRLQPHFKSVDAGLQDMIAELQAMSGEEGPDTLNDAYVAFYRNQAARLDDIEQKLYRIEAAARPVDKTTELGFPVKPPSMKTTWLIIYIILGFLAFVSLLFFFRWYGKGKAETFSTGESGGQQSEQGAGQ